LVWKRIFLFFEWVWKRTFFHSSHTPTHSHTDTHRHTDISQLAGVSSS
jgi:hypothetical protein